ncbi:desi1 [Symbiodinium natans]|uniref:Desi1 protein n=1 Tax=Symbiodinium natans TaxID=878477 RepID=A0A812RP93_9DINO|nr:desi1 [Symbiodinium natans]
MEDGDDLPFNLPRDSEEDEDQLPLTLARDSDPDDHLPLTLARDADPDDQLPLTLARDSDPDDHLPLTLARDSALDDHLPLNLPKHSEASLDNFLSSDQAALNSVLMNILSKFSELDADGSGAITMDELATHWLSAATEVCKRPLSDSEKDLIGASVQRAFDVMDVEQDGMINKHEWLHTALLDMHPPGPVANEIITRKLREPDAPDVSGLVHTWLSSDELVCGMVTRKMLSTSLNADPDVLDVLNTTGNENITYAEFVASELHLTFMPVELYYYDLSKNFASVLSPVLLGQYEEGIWHTSVGVFGQELYFFGYILTCYPGQSAFGQPRKSIQLGHTLRTVEELNEEIKRVYFDYRPDLYDAFDHNCNDLSNHMVQFLLGRPIPDSVRLMSERLKSSSLVKVLRPMLNRMLGNRQTRGKQDGEDKLLELEASARARRNNARHQNSSNSALSVDKHVISANSLNLEFEGPDSEEDSGPNAAGMAFAMAGKDAAPRQLTGMVLFRASGASAPVVAQVEMEHSDGTFDIGWFDQTGSKQQAAGVPGASLEPYIPALQASALLKEVFSRASQALPPTLDRWSSMDIGRGDLQRAMTCLDGHPLVRSQPSYWSSSVQCRFCQVAIPAGQVRMHCYSCNYTLCGKCFLQHQNPNVGQNLAGFEEVRHSLSVWPKCDKGHSFERFGGGSSDGGTACSSCKQQEIGSTGPFFLICRFCQQQLCHDCARRSICALLDAAYEPRVAPAPSDVVDSEAVRRVFAAQGRRKILPGIDQDGV